MSTRCRNISYECTTGTHTHTLIGLIIFFPLHIHTHRHTYKQGGQTGPDLSVVAAAEFGLDTHRSGFPDW